MADRISNLRPREKGESIFVATPATYAVITISLMSGPMTVNDLVLASRASRQSVCGFLRVLRESGILRFAGKRPDKYGRLSIPAWEISPEGDEIHVPRMETDEYKAERAKRKSIRQRKRYHALKQWSRQLRQRALKDVDAGSSERDAQLEFLYRLSGVFDAGKNSGRSLSVSETVRGGSIHLLTGHNCTQVQTSQESADDTTE